MTDKSRADARALEYLRADELLHAGMIFPITRGTARVIYAERDGVFFEELDSGAFMLSASSYEKGIELLGTAGRRELYCVYQKCFFDYLAGAFEYQTNLQCVQAVYRGSPLRAHAAELDIKALDTGYLDTVYGHYEENVGREYLLARIKAGEIFGGFSGGRLAGFIGTHAEGSIGLLGVFEPFRRQGYAEELECFMINRALARGQLPFAQISVGNEASLALQRKLGLEMSKDILYWLF